MIVFAHLGHSYSAFGFLVPAVLVVLWIRFQGRRERRRQEFAQYWTLELRGAEWKLIEMAPALLGPFIGLWVGTWYLVRGPGGWLLDQPQLTSQ